MYYIYKITNKINGKFYVGRHKASENESFDKYWGSGVLIKKAIDKYGIDNFTKEIIEYCTEENINEREVYWINTLKARENNYNISTGGAGGDSTLDTEVYNNGHHIIYLRKGEHIPEGFKKGSLPKYHNEEWHLKCSKSSKGKNKNKKPWNKGKNIDNIKVKLNAELAKATIVNQGILKGANNPRAKTYILIDPDGNKYTVTGRLREFCKEHCLSKVTLSKNVNKGPIKISPHNSHKEATFLNTMGWEVIVEDKNFVEEARKSRLKHYKLLKDKNLLTKRQNNINKIIQIGEKDD